MKYKDSIIVKKPLQRVVSNSKSPRRKCLKASPGSIRRRKRLKEEEIAIAPPPILLPEVDYVSCTVKCKTIALGGYLSFRETDIQVYKSGLLAFSIMTEERSGAKVIIRTEEIIGCSVTEKVIAIKLQSVSGILSRYIIPGSNDKSTVVIQLDVINFNVLEDIRKRLRSMYGELPTTTVGVLESKVRLMSAQSSIASLTDSISLAKGENLNSLSDIQLSQHRESTFFALQKVQHLLDSKYASLLSEHHCVCCTDSLTSILLLPCRHMVLCGDCYKQLSIKTGEMICPLCRTAVEEHHEAYRS